MRWARRASGRVGAEELLDLRLGGFHFQAALEGVAGLLARGAVEAVAQEPGVERYGDAGAAT